MWIVYLVKCSDGKFYCGYTTDIKKRLDSHNTGKFGLYTRERLPVSLVYSEEHESKSVSQGRRDQIRALSSAMKSDLVEGRTISFQAQVRGATSNDLFTRPHRQTVITFENFTVRVDEGVAFAARKLLREGFTLGRSCQWMGVGRVFPAFIQATRVDKDRPYLIYRPDADELAQIIGLEKGEYRFDGNFSSIWFAPRVGEM